MNFDLRIEELVLQGFPPDERQIVGDAVERELARLFTERGVPPSLARARDVSRLDAGTFELAPDLTPAAVGARVARSLYEGITR